MKRTSISSTGKRQVFPRRRQDDEGLRRPSEPTMPGVLHDMDRMVKEGKRFGAA